MVEAVRNMANIPSPGQRAFHPARRDDSAPPLMACPCEEGRKLRDCHGPKLAELRPHLPPKQFETELREMIQLARAGGIRLPERKIMLKRMWKCRERQWQKRSKRKR